MMHVNNRYQSVPLYKTIDVRDEYLRDNFPNYKAELVVTLTEVHQFIKSCVSE